MIHFCIYEDTFPNLYKWLMETYQPNMDNFSDKEGEPYFYIDFQNNQIIFNRDSFKLSSNVRRQILTTKVVLELQVTTGLFTIVTPERKIYSKKLETYK